ncbi:MAG TPA: 2-oxo acid dehydrogenase subunit E2 [Acidimicrobiia bacterium]|nr:2-oxo acid dehydrogenase subunit E2 [Acidimicrobiia bacterium]
MATVHPARTRRRLRRRPGFRSPVVRRLIAEHQLDTVTIDGTGTAGRVTREDVLRVLDTPPLHEVVPLNRVQRLTGQHMLRSLRVAPHAFIAMEVDFEQVERVRRPAGLTYLPFVARAVVDAVAAYPHVNAAVGDGELVVHRAVHLGIAVDLDHEGLIVPVVRDADSKRLGALAGAIDDLAARARAKRLAPDDIAGGTFTITNPGPSGTAISAPIIHPPQVAILSTDGVRRRPVVVETDDGTDAIAPHAVGMLGLSFDHRAFDGAYASAFLARVREIVETRPWDVEV